MIDLITPRVEINLVKLAHNAEKLFNFYASKKVGIMGVTKVICGQPEIAKVLVNKGIRILADSKLINLKKMRDAGIKAEFVLLRTPALSEIDLVIKYADISMNTEIAVIKSLSETATKNKTLHKIILMIEMGDLREGIRPLDLDGYVQETLKLPGIKIVGIGANFSCFGGVKPTEEKMRSLSSLAIQVEKKFALPLIYVSGGNSANYNWFKTAAEIGSINNLRLGESIFLGRETLGGKRIPELFTDVFTFISEVIESKIKSSVPDGELGRNAFGISPKWQDRGQIRRAILGVGIQDVLVGGLTPKLDIEILGSSSDHTILDAKKVDLKVGDEVAFNLDYGALLSVMTSPYVTKKHIHTNPD
ncbi:alanine/ornithine racemase family PLP-dependent enzyme [Bacillus sp. CECT 9360]|uniref:alanine/ornithine racemase family PLP-dependent enzyme n=1 Tax=Bacillus sp. CECT 9360 TaxID=2845821 RepID=UPI001E2B7274|nr:alanine/ornithine racemase family PLP-dependent enzyme [Bacillus sp. CECT 9360]CAH0346030.1 Ornithine racemase [Bacillus sp. CECT 9360]